MQITQLRLRKIMEIDPTEILNELNVQFPNELRIAILTVQNRKLQELLEADPPS